MDGKRRVLILLITLLLLGVQVVEAQQHAVEITAYNSSRSRKCDKPGVTASSLGLKTCHYRRVISLSADLAKAYEFGDRFKLIVGDKEFIVAYEDRMHKKWRRRVDLFMSHEDAKAWGRKKGILVPLTKGGDK